MLFPLIGQKAHLSHVWNLEEQHQAVFTLHIHSLAEPFSAEYIYKPHTLWSAGDVQSYDKATFLSFQYPGRWEGGILFNVIFLKHDRIHKSKNYLRDGKMAQQAREVAVLFVLPTWWPKTVPPISRDSMSSGR